MVIEHIYLFDEFEDDFTQNGETMPEFIVEPEINRVINNRFVLTGTYDKSGQNSHLLKEDAILRAYCPDRSYQLFRIVEIDLTLDYIPFVAFNIATADANRNFIESFFEANGSGQKIMAGLEQALAFKQPFTYSSNILSTHQFTAKEGNPISIIQGSNNGGQNLVGVTGGELDFDNFNIKLLDRLGQDNGFRVDFRINLESIEIKKDGKGVFNSLYLIGAEPEGDYDTEQDPIVFKYLEMPGVTNKTRRITKRTNSECKTLEELKKWGQSLFDKDRIHEPKNTIKINMIDLAATDEYKDFANLVELNIGDTVYATLDGYEDIKDRMIEYVFFPRLKSYKTITLGNDTSMYTDKNNEAIQNTLKELERQENILTEKILNATNLITGTSGGYVRFRPKNNPSEILIMDTDNVNTAKLVWRWNLGGLGHSKNGVNGPFETAMTSDGQIVANIITAGQFNAEMLRVGFNGIGDTLQLVSNALQIHNNKVLIMELTKQGLEFRKDKETVGRIGTQGDIWTWVAGAGENLFKDKAIFIELGVKGEMIQIGTATENGILIHRNGFIDSRGDWTHAGPFSVAGRMNVTELFIKGQQVFPGGTGGGSWNGQYPPEITTQAEKYAWQYWVTSLSLNFTPEATAAKLGNYNTEVGPSMNPDTEQVNGPAYGLPQFDGSAYPLVGSPTWNGREYVQRLMNAAGIKDDYKTSPAQAKLVDWAGVNGQWSPNTSPASFTEFKKMTDVRQATLAFELNFEKHAGGIQPQRQTDALKWYNKFKDLKQPGGKYGHPVMIGTPITSWFGERWGQMHNGIDFGGAIGDPIFAAQSGTVWLSEFDNDMGEWIIIKHDTDGYMTGYAHNDVRLVKVGDKVAKGQQIARMGSTGDSTGPHLHFAVQTEKWSGYVDPAPFLGLTPP